MLTPWGLGQAEELLRRAEEHLAKKESRQALEAAEECSKIFLRIFGSNDVGYASCQRVRGAASAQLGSYDNGMQFLKEARQIRSEVLGRQHADYANTIFHLGSIHVQKGAYEVAEPLWEEARKIRFEVLGPRHPDYAQSLNGLGVLCWYTGSYHRAEDLQPEAKQIRFEVLGPRHPDYGASLNTPHWRCAIAAFLLWVDSLDLSAHPASLLAAALSVLATRNLAGAASCLVPPVGPTGGPGAIERTELFFAASALFSFWRQC